MKVAIRTILALLLFVVGCSAQQLTLTPSPLVPVTFQDSTDLLNWSDVVDNCTNLSMLPSGNRFFRGKLEREVVTLKCDPMNSIDGVRIYNGPAAGNYTEHFDFPNTNLFRISATIFPTNHFAATTFANGFESDFSPEAVQRFTNEIIITQGN